MKSAIELLPILFLVSFVALAYTNSFEDNDFAEFDDFDSDFIELESERPSVTEKVPAAKKEEQSAHPPESNDFVNIEDDEDGIIEDEENEFDHFQDEEEFEGFDAGDAKETPSDPKTEPKLTVAKIPVHFSTHWDSYWMEMLMLAGLLAYSANFFYGKAKNCKLANLWYITHKNLLEDNFALVGDDGKMENDGPRLMKESESLYTLWCSGRTCCEGMLVELRMIKRQDVVALITKLLRSQHDQVNVKIEMTKGVMDTFVFCVGQKKTVSKILKEYTDLNKFCNLVSKPEERYNVPSGFGILSELPEATSAMLDSRLVAALNKYQRFIDYIHISDQFSGPIQQDDTSTLKQPETKCMLLFGFIMPQNGDMEVMKPLFILVFYIMERLRVYRLSREGKMKADKNRLRVEEDFLKSTHAARAEAAAQRREDKRRQEKDRVFADDDPEKQRRWEMKEQKRQAKKKAPKMKRLAVKAI